MKKTTSAIIVLFLFLIPALGSSSYLIRLKNGRQLTTPAYWFEGKRIFFYIAGGTAGMERTEIDGIEEHETGNEGKAEPDKAGKSGLPRLSSIMEESPSVEKRPADSEQKPSPGKSSEKGGKEASKKDPRVMEEFDTLRKKFESRKGMTLDELKDLKNDLTALRDKIASGHSGEDFREEVAKIADMRFFTNDLIIVKSRSR